jgi:hypothetical protein
MLESHVSSIYNQNINSKKLYRRYGFYRIKRKKKEHQNGFSFSNFFATVIMKKKEKKPLLHYQTVIFLV